MNHTPPHVALGAGPAGFILGTHLTRAGARVRDVSSSTTDLGPATTLRGHEAFIDKAVS